jgi:long-chain acyl-CoA synthetase
MVDVLASIYSQKPWLAHYHVAPEISAPATSLIDAFEQTVCRNPDAPAIHHFDRTISFGRLNELATRFAAMLAGWGVGPRDRVALSFQNDPQFAVAQLGVWKRGGIVVPLNPMFKQKEMDFHLQDSGARVWVGLDTLQPGPDSVEHCVPVGMDDFEMLGALGQSAADESVRVPVACDEIAYLVYTSGTTGNPKGAINLHRNVMFNAEVYRAWMRIGAGDAILGIAPLFHITGLVAQLALSTVAGVPLILFHRFDACRALELARKWNATLSVAAVTAYIALMNADSPVQRFVPKCYSGGAPVAPSITEQFERRFGTYIHNIYGLTESNSPSHATPLGTRAPVDPSSGALSIGVPFRIAKRKSLTW